MQRYFRDRIQLGDQFASLLLAPPPPSVVAHVDRPSMHTRIAALAVLRGAPPYDAAGDRQNAETARGHNEQSRSTPGFIAAWK